MIYYGAKELAASFRTVRANTIVIAEEIPEAQYSFRPAAGCRSLAESLSHIAISTRFPQQVHFIEHRSKMEGFDFFAFFNNMATEEQTSRTKLEIIELLRTEGEKFAKQLDGLSEEFLGEAVEFPQAMGQPPKTRFEMLLGSKEHEMHHRGQLMLVERMIGIVPHLTRQMEERIASMKAAAAAQ